MKTSKFLIAFYIFSNCIFPQTKIQNGLVRELNSDKKAIAGVQIIFTDAKATDSDDRGKFQLVFQNKKAGDIIIKEKIHKSGFELVNEKDFDIVKISNTDALGVDIIMAKEGTVEAAKREYYEVSDQELLASFNKEKKNLQEQLKEAQISQKDFEIKLTALQEEYDNQKKQLDELAEMFARVNFDDVSELYREALGLFKAGKINEAEQKLDNADLIGRTNQRIQERERIEGAEEEIARQKAENEKGIKEDIESIQLLTKIKGVKLKTKEAEALFDQLFLLDSTRLDILQECANFYRENHRYNKALRMNHKIIDHPDVENWQKANAYEGLGRTYEIIGSIKDALFFYLEFQKLYTNLSKENPSSLKYRGNVAVSYDRLGRAYTKLGDYKSALIYFEEYNRRMQILFNSNPQNLTVQSSLSNSYFQLGMIYDKMDSLYKAFSCFEKSNHIVKELFDSDTSNAELKFGLSASYSRLGDIQSSLDNFILALDYYEKDIKLIKELFEVYPNNIEYKHSLATSNQLLGRTYTSLGNFEMAIRFFNEDIRLKRELCEIYPQNTEFKVGLGTSHASLAYAYLKKNEKNKALFNYLEAEKLFKKLVKQYPDIKQFYLYLEKVQNVLAELLTSN